jgi:hypothetical protein
MDEGGEKTCSPTDEEYKVLRKNCKACFKWTRAELRAAATTKVSGELEGRQ